MKIGILGGTFDPIHLGHTKIIQAAYHELNLDQVMIIPTKNNPWKEGCSLTIDDRLKLIDIAIRDFPYVIVNSIELEQDGNQKNYTIDTLLALKKQYPHDQFYYIMGMDQASQFDKWKSAKEISQIVQLVAFDRTGYVRNDNIDKYHFIMMKEKDSMESSTSIKEGCYDMLDQHVLHYMCQHGLYLENFIRSLMSKQRYLHTLSVAKLAREIAISNGIDPMQAYIASMLHDIAKELDKDKERELMELYYPQFIDKPRAIYHQWLSAYMAKTVFGIEDQVILQAIENHTTGSIHMSPLDMCVYCADKLDPIRDYDTTEGISVAKEDIVQGFRYCLNDFYQFSKKKNRDIDECFYEIYKKYGKVKENE